MDSSHDDVVASVSRSMAWAAHKRDHAHGSPTQMCHPHAVEVVHLGRRAVTVCHDCAADSGLLAEKDAEQLAVAHRRSTAEDDVPLPHPAVA